MKPSISSVVLGAGLMGRLLAHALAQLGHRVLVHEAMGPDGQGSAARVAAAMLAPLAESAITELPVVHMGHHALKRWPELIAKLPDPVFFQQNGTLVVWHRQDAAEAKRFENLLLRTQQQCPELPALQRLGAQGLQSHEPGMEKRFNQGLYLPGEGQLDNRELLASLLKGMSQMGVDVRWNSPCSPRNFQAGQPGQPNWVFDCRGLGARDHWAQLRGVRGEVLRLYAPEVPLQRPTRLIHPRYPIYIAPKENHVFVVGATEIETEDLSAVSVRSTLELLSAAYTVHSGFAEARILEASTQARPTLVDNLPAIRCLNERTLQINGLYRHGFLISPAMLDVVLEWVQHRSTQLATRFKLKFQHA
ncbi:MAG: FAD-dependent oxidoreductase [Limnohabitans sp.]|jgi:glycine oxidase|uniref:FAD-dependent oxidoreductase n=1 Tax=Limnohabitans sp. TaxID=1907725 RepID=UPI0025E7B5C3|nr:FAD-dependent oxidoreductase [Limnohabitans sp.]MCO4088845.1 FAD-dependent oxidoreductase [Limnohabitans sp.]